MAMKGQFYAYDALVPLSEIDFQPGYMVRRAGVYYALVADATRPASLDAMPLGLDRYNAYQDHAKAAIESVLPALKAAFPELSHLTEFPKFLLELPGFEASHATAFAEVANA